MIRDIKSMVNEHYILRFELKKRISVRKKYTEVNNERRISESN